MDMSLRIVAVKTDLPAMMSEARRFDLCSEGILVAKKFLASSMDISAAALLRLFSDFYNTVVSQRHNLQRNSGRASSAHRSQWIRLPGFKRLSSSSRLHSLAVLIMYHGIFSVYNLTRCVLRICK